jgi:hypothetical protein
VKRHLSSTAIAWLSFVGAGIPAAYAIPGATDRVPAATLLVPFFQVGVSSGVNPHDTLLVVHNVKSGTARIHYEVWDIDGRPSGLRGNATLASFATFSRSMRSLITPASATIKTKLKVGAFYQGFVTIDLVTASTALAPTSGSYPFSNDNRLEGNIYYSRIAQGAVSGLTMVPIESFPAIDNSDVRVGFYVGFPPAADPDDHREQLTPGARSCAHNLASSQPCGFDLILDRIDLRTFQAPAGTGSSFGVVFSWDPGDPGGPSNRCEDFDDCDPNFPFTQYNEAGAVVASGTRRLDHAVNVIPFTGTQPGWFTLKEVANAGHLVTSFYAFSVNIASPAGGTNRWEDAFEGYIQP